MKRIEKPKKKKEKKNFTDFVKIPFVVMVCAR